MFYSVLQHSNIIETSRSYHKSSQLVKIKKKTRNVGVFVVLEVTYYLFGSSIIAFVIHSFVFYFSHKKFTRALSLLFLKDKLDKSILIYTQMSA